MSNSDTLSREVAIATKAKEIQSLLEEWARDSEILNSGERIVFSLRIEGVPTVVQETSGGLWDMPAGEFFDSGRLKKHGVHHSMSWKIQNAIFNDGAQATIMREFLSKYTVRDFRLAPSLGKKCLEEIERVLTEAGMTIKQE